MKKYGIAFCIASLMSVGVVYATGFLKAQSFPKTFQDLPFEIRMDILADGYEAWESVYDSNGRCISGCAYHGITIQEEEELSRAATEELQQLIEQEEQQGQMPVDSEWGQNFFGPPLAGDLVVTSDFGKTKRNNGTTRNHKGIDLRAAEGTPVYATADGVVKTVAYDKENGGGCYVLISHAFSISDKQIFTSYAHLGGCNDADKKYSNPTVKVGDKVQKGQQIGISGNSGSSSAPHLHYKIRDEDKRHIDPLGFKQNVNYLGAKYSFSPDAFNKSGRIWDGGYTCQSLQENFRGCQGCSRW